jgi:hypothetical protein
MGCDAGGAINSDRKNEPVIVIGMFANEVDAPRRANDDMGMYPVMLLKTFAQFSGIKHTWPVDSCAGRIAMSLSGIIPCESVPSNCKKCSAGTLFSKGCCE